ncbi:type II toxin-antitoxin system RelE family toxin [Flavobacterium pectinovorum]|uniref:Plasmid stabilization protein n=1 Tax=Flavobacterium pectinovorum TaxID=29533 RepID=A0A502ETK2_9FLAO|nr:type II toxin-antitoxin system RelE/ParE family toxin [Flavobacterium pectinovorum]TPG40149.1 plasmid stabilization protein [Flavobacterium pectinovorum]
MKVIFGKLFSKDLIKIKDSTLKDNVIQVIIALENVEDIQEIPNIKKMKGHPEAYRIRIGKYRLGFFFDGEVVELTRFAKREDIYKLFP